MTADPMYYGLLKEKALEMRKNPTKAEQYLWEQLKNSEVGDVKFRRQHIIDRFIADFFCAAENLIIEVDGKIHELPDHKISDAERTQILTGLGYRVLRFTNDEILHDTQNVLARISDVLTKTSDKKVQVETPALRVDSPPQGGLGGAKGKILMATVKGDVHDIGKNIVGVVLACNNYEIVDLGVMVPADKILKTAIEEKVDVIGLSGLITPSLDEMVHVAKEMQRLGLNIPLMIGGATTSKTHTAVKVEPQYSNAPVVHVLDASRSVAVVSSLLTKNREENESFVQAVKTEYEQIRVQRASRQTSKQYLSLQQARANKVDIDWSNYAPPKPAFTGLKTFDNYSLEELSEYIDWTPFFQSWQLAGKFPAILDDEIVGTEAKKLFHDAQVMLRRIIDEKWLTARAVIGIFPANSVGHDDIQLYRDENRREPGLTLHHLRQQNQKAAGQPNFCLSDFIAPADSGKADYIGAFAVTAGIGIETKVKEFEAVHDDYSAILLKALADRLAEAFAERMHERVRKEFWGYAAAESLDNQQLIDESYQGIRPAPGYPACPEHTEKRTLWQLLEPDQNAGISLTESCAMYPTAAVSGWYFSHPESRYFGLGQISKDQVEDYARRKGMSLAEAERWLAPVLNYDN